MRSYRTKSLNRQRTEYAAFALAMHPDWEETYFQTEILAPLMEAITAGDEDFRRVIFTLPFRYSKPLSITTPVLLESGYRIPLGAVCPGDRVITHLGRGREVLAVHSQGKLPILEIETHHGRTIRSAPEHPFLTPLGWKKAKDLIAGESLAVVAAPLCTPTVLDRKDEEFRLAGYFVGDGSTGFTSGQSFETHERPSINAKITNADVAVVEDLYNCARVMGWEVHQDKHDPITYTFKGGVRAWLRESRLAGCTAHSKRVPRWVFSAPPHQIAQFVGAYFDCDGFVTKRGLKFKSAKLEISSVNRLLLADIQHLLVRLGICSRIRRREGSYTYKGATRRNEYWVLYLSDLDNVARFAQQIPLRTPKRERLQEWGVLRTKFAPVAGVEYVADQITSIKWADAEECRCLTVEEDESFLANDVVVHNTEFCFETFIPFYFGHNPSNPVIFISYGKNIARKSGRKIRDIMKSPEYIELFPDAALKQSSRASDEFETVSGGKFFAGGFDTGVNGRGAKLLVIDDPHKNLQDVNSEKENENVRNVYTSVVRTRCEPGAAILMSGVRWVPHDLIGWRIQEDGAWDVMRKRPYDDQRVLEEGRLEQLDEDDPRNVVELNAIKVREEEREQQQQANDAARRSANGAQPQTSTVLGPDGRPVFKDTSTTHRGLWKVVRLTSEALVDEGFRRTDCACGLKDKEGNLVPHGEPLWPEHWSCQANYELKMSDATVYESSYLLRPSVQGGYWFVKYPPNYYKSLDLHGMNVYIICDPSLGQHKKSDKTAIGVFALGQDQNDYLVDLVWERLGLIERIDHIFRLHRKWRPLALGYEEYGMMSDHVSIQERMEKENYRFRITILGREGIWGSTKSKPERVRTLVPKAASGRLWFPDPEAMSTPKYLADYMKAFVEQQWNRYPSSQYDDVLDMMSRLNDPQLRVRYPLPSDRQLNYGSSGGGKGSWMSA